MAIMVPNLTEEMLSGVKSSAERRLYREFEKQLPDDYTVFFEVAWLLKREDEAARDGETDFIICHPSLGYLCVEVKGGGIKFDGEKGTWTSIDRHGNAHSINDPIRQSTNAMHSIRRKLNENEIWRKKGLSRVRSGRALFFPDIANASKFSGINIDKILIGTSENIDSLEKWVKGCFDYWNVGNNSAELGSVGVSILHSIFARTFEVKPSLSLVLKRTEETRIILTEEQFNILNTLSRQRRATITGGAGTGKTLLAIEKATRLANEGFKTLLTCFNSPLAYDLEVACRRIDNLEVLNFHQVCKKYIEEAKELTGRDFLKESMSAYPTKNKFNFHYPMALINTLDVVKDRYDAIVCDEGQDFGEEFWLALEMILSDEEKAPFYIFFDSHQNIFSKQNKMPNLGEPYPLSVNCRNTKNIHNEMMRYYSGIDLYEPKLDGTDASFLYGNSLEDQAVAIGRTASKLIAEEGIDPLNMVVLVVDVVKSDEYYNFIVKQPLPNKYGFAKKIIMCNDCLVATTVNLFKGLESDVVFLWGFDEITVGDRDKLMYVGISRAKTLLYFVGKKPT